MKLHLRFGLVAAVLLAIFNLYPQFKMLYLRGDDWNGHYAYNDIDEVAYAAYVRALIDGRPRKNDPYSGQIGRASCRERVENLVDAVLLRNNTDTIVRR